MLCLAWRVGGDSKILRYIHSICCMVCNMASAVLARRLHSFLKICAIVRDRQDLAGPP